MLSDKNLQKTIIKVAISSFVITLFIAAPFVIRRISKEDGESKPGSKVVRYGTKRFAWGDSSGEKDAQSAEDGSSASEKQLKPSFGNLPHQLFPGNRPFSLDFHKLPTDFLTPQQPEIMRRALVKIRELNLAELAALEAQQAMANNYEKPNQASGRQHAQ